QEVLVADLRRAEKLKEMRHQANLLTGEIVKSVFRKIIGDPLTNPMKWKSRKIREFCEMGTGGTPRRSVQSYYGGAIPWVKSGEVNLRYVYDTEEKLTKEGLENSSAKFFPLNTVLIAMYGATAGKVALLKVRATTNQAICGLTPDPQIAHYSYLQHCLEYLAPTSIAQTVGTGQPNLSQEILGEVEVPIPPLELQEEFAAFADALVVVQQRQQESAKQVDELFLSLLGNALRG